MAARSVSEHDYAFPGRFYRRIGSAILLLKKTWIRGCIQSRRLPATIWTSLIMDVLHDFSFLLFTLSVRIKREAKAAT